MAEKFFAAEKESRRLKKIATELEEVREFYDAEEEHQQVKELPIRPHGRHTGVAGGCRRLPRATDADRFAVTRFAASLAWLRLPLFLVFGATIWRALGDGGPPLGWHRYMW